MYSNRVIFFTLFFGLMIANFPLSAALNFKQDVTLTSFKSEEDSKEMVNRFLKAAEGDSDIKVIQIKYKQEKKKDYIAYHSTITCLASKPDDIMRVECKSILNSIKNNLE
jgi:hypothetical protein